MKTIPMKVNGNNTCAEVKEKLAAMEGIEADSISMLTFQGRQCSDDAKLKDIKGITNHNFYATRRLRGGGVSKPRHQPDNKATNQLTNQTNKLTNE